MLARLLGISAWLLGVLGFGGGGAIFADSLQSIDDPCYHSDVECRPREPSETIEEYCYRLLNAKLAVYPPDHELAGESINLGYSQIYCEFYPHFRRDRFMVRYIPKAEREAAKKKEVVFGPSGPSSIGATPFVPPPDVMKGASIARSAAGFIKLSILAEQRVKESIADLYGIDRSAVKNLRIWIPFETTIPENANAGWIAFDLVVDGTKAVSWFGPWISNPTSSAGGNSNLPFIPYRGPPPSLPEIPQNFGRGPQSVRDSASRTQRTTAPEEVGPSGRYTAAERAYREFLLEWSRSAFK